VASAQERPDAHDLGETCIGPCAMEVKATGQATYAKPRPRVKIANCAQVSAERLAAANNLHYVIFPLGEGGQFLPQVIGVVVDSIHWRVLPIKLDSCHFKILTDEPKAVWPYIF
jgi:hypothetical protein